MLDGGSRWARTKGLPPRVAASFVRGSVDPLRRSSGSTRSPPLGLRFAGSYSTPLSFLGIQTNHQEFQIQIIQFYVGFLSWVLSSKRSNEAASKLWFGCVFCCLFLLGWVFLFFGDLCPPDSGK